MLKNIQNQPIARKHHYHSPYNRALYCLFLIGFMLGFGTWGMHHFESFSYLDSFYFTSMIATGQGPPPAIAPITSAGKLFACLMAFISMGFMVAALGFLFGPFLGQLWKVGVMKFEEEIQHLHKK